MSGPKIIDIAATRQRERLRLEVIAKQIDSALARFEHSSQSLPGWYDSQMPSQVREQFSELQRKAELSDKVVDIIGMVETAKSQLFFVSAEKKRLDAARKDWRVTEASNRKSLDQTIKRLLQSADGDSVIIDELKRAETETEFLEKAKIVERVSREMEQRIEASEYAAQSDAIQKLTKQWEKLVANGNCNAIELPVLPQARWRIEIERIRDELSDNTEIANRIKAVENEGNAEKRQMLLDGLRYDAAALLKSQRDRNERLEWIAQTKDAYESLGILTAEIEIELENALKKSSSDYSVFQDATNADLNAALEASAAAYARQAILESLETLGYEVREGMDTAWIEDGKIVLSKPNESTFGLELSRMPAGTPSLIKTRVVRTKGVVAATADEKQRDREQEQSWCGEREEMEKLLDEKGIELTIKTARQPGDIPVEAVAEAVGSRQERMTREERRRQ